MKMVSFQQEFVIFLFLFYFPVMLLSTRYNISSIYCKSPLHFESEIYYLCENHAGNQIVSDNRKFALGHTSMNRDIGLGYVSMGYVVLLLNNDNTQGNPVWKFPVWYTQWQSWNPAGYDTGIEMELSDDGNLVIYFVTGSKYESFNNPDDTLLPNQTLSLGMRLNSGEFSVIVDFNRILFVKEWKTLLWTWNLMDLSCNTSYTNVLYTGTELQISNDCQTFSVATTTESNAPELPLLRLDSTSGAFFSYKYQSKTGIWIKDVGGDANLPFWTTVPFKYDNPDSQRNNNQLTVCTSDGKCHCLIINSERNCSSYYLYHIDGVAITSINESLLYGSGPDGDIKYFYKPQVHLTSLEGCKNACLKDTCSNCSGVLLYINKSSNCFFYSAHPQFSVSTESELENYNRLNPTELVLVIPVTFMILWTSAIFMLGIAGYRLKFNPAHEIESLLASTQGLPQRFPYTTLATATMGFSEKLGSGGYGSVYKGTLNDKRVVAVKKLDSPTGTQGAKQFVTEVAGIGGISHVNIVKLCGFCVESATTHCLLVYDYMSNGSLDKWLFESKENQAYLTWQQRVNIALGTAQGLLYLHEESSEPILHLDIKPQNILLDERFTAKLADFGMAKLLENRDITQVHTCMRGTPGYMAPEWLTHFTATKKSDVFSYGMVLLEIIGGRKNVDHSRINVDEGNEGEIKDEDDGGWYFPPWVMRQVRDGNILGVVDAKVRATASENIQLVKTLVHLALWCIQSNPGTRPPMQTVVQVLHGHLELGPAPVSLPLYDNTSSGSSMTDMWNSGTLKRM